MENKYTGTNGFYSGVSTKDISELTKFFTTVVKETLPCNSDCDIGLNCTTMYSLTPLLIKPVLAYQLRDRYDGVMDGSVTGFDYWDGNDGVGYFVANVDSPQLALIHDVWLRAGAKPTYPEYSPHITLATGEAAKAFQSRLDTLNKQIEAYGTLPVTFDRLTITDLKD